MLKRQSVLTPEIKEDVITDYFLSTHNLKMRRGRLWQGQGNFRVTSAVLEQKKLI